MRYFNLKAYKKFLLPLAVSFLILSLFLEINSRLSPKLRLQNYFGTWKLNPHYNLKQKKTKKFISRFDVDLGWENINGHKTNFRETSKYFAQSYGNSFVHSISDSNTLTWQEIFENFTGRGILNLGSDGFGMDQSFLKFKKYHKSYMNKLNTKVAIFGLYSQQFRRNLYYHGYYYSKVKNALYNFKPLFIKKGQSFELVNIPCKDMLCLDTIFDSNIYNNVTSNHDYWFQDNEQKPIFKSPVILSYLKTINYMAREKWRYYKYGNIFLNNHSRNLTIYLVKQFVSESKAQGVKPVFLIFYNLFELNKYINDENDYLWLIKYLESSNIEYIDTLPLFQDFYSEHHSYDSLFIADGHYSQLGNTIIAKALLNKFEN